MLIRPFPFSASGGLASAPVDGGSSSSGRAAAAAFHTGVGGSAAKLAAEQLYHFTPRDYASSYSHYQVCVLTNQLTGRGGKGGSRPSNFWNNEKKCVFNKPTIKVCVSCC